jgi:hypothetical protein
MLTHASRIHGSLTESQQLGQSIRTALAGLSPLFAITLAGLAAASAAAADAESTHARYCSTTTALAFLACRNANQDSFQIATAICLNLADEDERKKCEDDAEEAREEGHDLCRDQQHARRDVCRLIGEARYDPDFDPDLFDEDFGNTNPYYPLAVGNQREYEGDGETVSIEVLDRTKSIEGVTCLVVNDRVFVDGVVVEDTDDWFAQAKNGDVWYCGEEVKDYETFEDDDPVLPELVSIDGLFKAGRDGDKPGIVFRDMPRRNEAYRQEFSLGNAEDVAHVVSVSYRYGVDAELDRFVPEDLANLLCAAGDCVVVHEFSALEPQASERKFYAAHIGEFLGIDLVNGTTVQLVDCNYDLRCAQLPPPVPAN